MKSPTLTNRRLRGDMIEGFKIMSGKYDLEVADLFVKSTTLATRGHSYKLFKKRPKLDVRKFSFCYRVVYVWNKLPAANTVH